MAVQSSDNRFDWCYSLAYGKRNYNPQECLNIIKNQIKSLKGADQKFVKHVLGLELGDVKILKYWFPVYSTTITATYIWDTESESKRGDTTIYTTTTHTKTNTFTRDVYRSVYDNLDVNTYVGRNDQRFYVLKHVNDLDAPIYNNSCVYSEGDMYGRVKSIASANDPGSNSNITINSWQSDVYFTPIIRFVISYNNSTYDAYVNEHNGHTHYTYVIDQSLAKKAKTMHKISVGLRIATPVFLALGYLLELKKMLQSSGFLRQLFAVLLPGIGGLICTIKGFKLGHNEQHFLNEFGSEGDIGVKSIKSEIIFLALTILFHIIAYIVYSV